MSDFTDIERQDTSTLVRNILTCGKAADDEVIAAAMSLREVRRRVEAGNEASGEKWYSWARKNIPMCETKLYQLQAIANAKDPFAELERQRRLARERSKRSRKPSSGSFPERSKLKTWATTADREDICKVWQYAARLTRLSERRQQTPVTRAMSANAEHSN